MTESKHPTNGVFLCAVAAIGMAYGWGYRGVVGHEGGAMVPGAILGLAVCVASNRADWHRRAAVAGMLGAVGWAWGGSFSYMEQTFYTTSDSFIDVFYGYSCLFFLGAMWAGIGGAVLGLAFTESRSRIERLMRPLLVIGAAFLLVHLYLFNNQDLRDLYERTTAEHFHDADWFPALLVLIVAGAYALLRPKERGPALLYVSCAAAWWVGYLSLTKFGGISLAPPYRNEGWGGVLGILVVLLAYLVIQRNRAALMLALYGLLAGGFGFSLAVFVRHPIMVSWGPFASWGGMMQWKIAEESFGLFMGLGVALGVVRLAQGGLATAVDDQPRKRLDILAAFIMLVVIMWMNLRRGPMAWTNRYNLVSDKPVAGLPPWVWMWLGGMVLTALVVYGLYLYSRDRLAIAPGTAYGKGVALLLLVLWVTAVGSFAQTLPAAKEGGFPLVDATFVLMCAVVTAMVLPPRNAGDVGPAAPATNREAVIWNVGWCYGMLWCIAPLVMVLITGLSMAMQDDALGISRKRFGEDAYWRKITGIEKAWTAVGMASEVGAPGVGSSGDAPALLVFNRDRSVVATFPDGSIVADRHTWQHADSVVWLEWFGRGGASANRASLPMTIKNGRLYIPWPPKSGSVGYLVLEPAAPESAQKQ